MALHIYLGVGFFLVRLPDGGIHIRVMSTPDLLSPHGETRIQSEIRLDGAQWTEALAMGSGKTLDEARKFWGLSE